MELAQFRKEPKVKGIPTRGIFLVVGDTKCGKTTFAASFPDSIVVEMERGRADRLANARVQEVNSLEEFGGAMELIMPEDSIKTVVIDSVDALAAWMAEDIAKAAGIPFLGKVQKGVDNQSLWGDFGVNVRAMVDWWKQSDKLFILVAHRRPANIDREGVVTKPAGINVSGKGGDYIAQQAEMVGFMGVRVLGGKTQHYLTFRGESDRAIWRSGVKELHDREVIVTEQDPYGCFASLFKTQTAAPKLTLAPAVKKSGGKK